MLTISRAVTIMCGTLVTRLLCNMQELECIRVVGGGGGDLWQLINISLNCKLYSIFYISSALRADTDSGDGD